jgi:U2 small nuclear ribonucleoprotein B''
MESLWCVLSIPSCLQGSPIAGQQRIEYAKTKSYATLKREDPDFVPPSVLKAQSNPPIALLNKNRMNGSGDSIKRSRDEDGEEGSRPRKRPNGTQEEDDQEMEIDEDEVEGDQTKPASASTPPSYLPR